MVSKRQIDDIIVPTIEGLGYESVYCEVISNNKSSKKYAGNTLRIYIDRVDNKSVSLTDCQLVNKHINKVLSVELGEIGDDIENYNIEVSSPGFDRPLVKIEHFTKFIGEKVKIRLNNPILHDDTGIMQKNIIGYIKEVDDNNNEVIIRHIDLDAIVYNININNIIKANLVPEWDKVSNKR